MHFPARPRMVVNMHLAEHRGGNGVAGEGVGDYAEKVISAGKILFSKGSLLVMSLFGMLVVFYIGSMLYVQNDRTNSCKCIFPVKQCTLFVMDSVRRDIF